MIAILEKHLSQKEDKQECRHEWIGFSIYPTKEYKEEGKDPLRIKFCNKCGIKEGWID